MRAYYAARLPKLNITSFREWRAPCPIHSGKDPNFSVNAETGLAQCHSQCGRGWDMISLEQDLFSLDFPTAKDRVFELVGRPKVPWEERNLEAVYDYTDERGKLLYQVLRNHGKDFKQRRPDLNGGWIWGLGDVRRVPFHLPRVMNADFVGITEGEKDALTLDRIGIVGSCNNGGAGNFRDDQAPYFASKHIAIFPDNDAPGRSHALKVAELIAPIAKTLKIIELPGLAEKGDVTDFVNAGGTIEQIREIYRKAQPWSPSWQFATNIPDENEKYVRTLEQDVEAAGGLQRFWDLAAFTGIPTPFPKLNFALSGGMRDGEIYVIGANQGAGKTSLVLQFALAAMRKGLAVLMFSMEMNWRAVFHRICGIEARIDLMEYRASQRRKTESKEDRFRLAHATAEIMQYGLLVSTKAAITPEYIVSETKRLAGLKPVDLVIVDHMQLMSPDQAVKTEYEKFTTISRALKQTAVEVKVPLLIASQTSRANSRERRSQLQVSDLRGSGAVEEDAAGVFLLFEDSEDAHAAQTDGNRYVKGPVKTWLMVGKNRYGMQGILLPLLHFKSITRFDVPETEVSTDEE